MIKVEATQQFTLEKFNEIKNLKRKSQEEEKTIFVGDVFECSQKMAEYLLGKNDKGVVVIKVIEIIPEEKPLKKQEKK